MIDPKLTILGLIKGGWGLTVTPSFSGDWVQEKAKFPQVIVNHVLTSPRPTGFSENQASTDRRMEGVYSVDVWSKSTSERWELLGEVDRILKSKQCDPGGGLESMSVSSWVDRDYGQTRPTLYRSQVRVEVLYYG